MKKLMALLVLVLLVATGCVTIRPDKNISPTGCVVLGLVLGISTGVILGASLVTGPPKFEGGKR